jgi:hypothetical protein
MTEKASGVAHAEEIDVHDEAECVRWTHELGITAGELKAAVHYAGPKVEDVRRYIDERTLPPLGNDPLGEHPFGRK